MVEHSHVKRQVPGSNPGVSLFLCCLASIQASLEVKSCRTIIWQNNYIPVPVPVPWSFSEELWNNNPSFARSEEDPGRLLFRRSLVVHVYVESLKYTKARILHVPWSFFWVRYHRYVGRYHTVGSYTKYVGRYLLLCT